MMGENGLLAYAYYSARLRSLFQDMKRQNPNDIIELHAEFEYIHLFQDGNGRVGRLIALKECLRHHIIPFLIEDTKKHYYHRGLSAWRTEKGWLTDICLDGQDTFIALLDMLDIPHQSQKSRMWTVSIKSP